MNFIFLLVIYLAFVSLGLPDTLLGSAWPVMQPELLVSLDAQGLITFIVSCATIISCLFNERIVRRLGTAKITALSGVVTAAALLGYAWCPSYLWLLLFSVPLGIGAGSVDTCLNNYAALHFPAKHVNWMTCCYAVGAAAGPLLLSFVLENDLNWRMGYLVIAVIQFIISFILIGTLPIWKGRDYKGASAKNGVRSKTLDHDTQQNPGKRRPLLFIPGVSLALICYALFFAIQYGTALWAPSYLVGIRTFSPQTAARTASLFYVCVMVGRLVSGFLSQKLSDKVLLRIGCGLCIVGAFCLGFPLPHIFYYIAMACIGVGCAPIFPSMIHLTPSRFGREDSQRVMGVQMAAAYAGNLIICPLIGVVAERIGVLTIPWFIFILCLLILVLSELVDQIVAKKSKPLN